MYNLSSFRKNTPKGTLKPLKSQLVKEDIPEQDWFGIYTKPSEYDKDGFDKNGFDKDGFDRFGWDQWGYDKDGYNKYKQDKFGNPKLN